MSKEVADLLRRAKAKIATPERWTQYKVARNTRGGYVDPLNPEATCWCSVGALVAVRADRYGPLYSRAVKALSIAAGYNIERFNDADETTHHQIVGVFDRAIAAEESAA